MNLKNYTSTVPVATSVSRIEHALVKAGASHIAKTYDPEGNLEGMMFQLRRDGNLIPLVFKLPARWQACEAVMWNEIRRPRPETRKNVHEQALRTAWKIMNDMEALEVFLPYVWNQNTYQTFFESLKQTGFKLLTSGSNV